MVYLNNASESYPKPLAVSSVVNGLPFLENGRNCDCAINKQPSEEFRVKLKKFLNLPDDYLVTITNSATESANLILRSIGEQCDVHYDKFSHNCIVRTCNEWFVYHPNSSKIADVYCLTHQSNITGEITDIKEKIEEIKNINKNAIIIVDISQSIGNIQIDVSSWNYDKVYVFGTMHKFMGSICGCGFVCHPKNNFLKPLITGGTGTSTIDNRQPTDYPNYLESGTKNSLAIACANKAIDINDNCMLEFNNGVKKQLVNYFKKSIYKIVDEELFMKFFMFHIVTYNNYQPPYVNLIPFNDLIGKSIAAMLYSKDIIVRYGNHCCPHFEFKIDNNFYKKSIRLSYNIFNTNSDTDTFLSEFNDILIKNYKIFKKL